MSNELLCAETVMRRLTQFAQEIEQDDEELAALFYRAVTLLEEYALFLEPLKGYS